MVRTRVTAATFTVAAIALVSVTADAAAPPTIVRCSAVKRRPVHLDGSHRFVLGQRVAFRRTPVLQTSRVGGPLPYWSRTPVFIRAGRMAITITVEQSRRADAAISWGNAFAQALRFPPCATPPSLSPNRWNGYDGGLYVRKPGCVPLRVRVGRDTATVRFGVGRAC